MIRTILFSDWRNVLIGILILAVIALAVLALPGRMPSLSFSEVDDPTVDLVSVLDVILDRQTLRTIDFLFSHAPGEGSVGEILEAPARVEPPTGGVWRWQSANILRFEATDRLVAATEYQITLQPETFLSEGQTLKGESRFAVVTDQFQVDRIDTYEEFVDQSGQVIIRGDIHFNYAVDPRELLPRLTLIDPLQGAGSPLPVYVETTYQHEVISFRTQPVSKHSDARELDLIIRSELTPAIGNVPLPADFTRKIPLGSAVLLAIRGVSSLPGQKESTIQVFFSSPVTVERLEQYLGISPEVSYRLSSQRNQLSVIGDFRPGESYELEIREGLTANDQSSLKETYRQSLTIPDLEPSVRFLHDGSFLSKSGYRNLEIETVNLSRVELTVDRVYPNNLFFLFQYHSHLYRNRSYYQSRLSHALGDRIAEKELRLTTERNQPGRLTLPLDEYIQEQQPGLYRVAVRRPDSYSGEQRWVLITDLGIVAKRGDQDFLVWVSSFRDLAPAANARIRLISSQNQLIAEGFTDTRGLWRLPSNSKDLSSNTPFLVTVEKGNDSSFLLLNASEVDLVGLDVSGSPASKTGYQAYLYGERDLYRPGETVRGVAIVRGTDLQTPPVMPLLLKHLDPQGRQRDTVRLDMASEGLAEFTVEIPGYELTGHHTFQLLVGEDIIGLYRFQVEEFVPDRIKVEISTAREENSLTEPLEYTVTGAYLFGPPAAALPVETTVHLRGTTFSHSSWPEFSFTNPDRRFESREIFQKQGTLDESGTQTFQVELQSKVEAPSSLEALLVARVQEQGGRGVTAIKRQRVHPYPYYLGIQRLGESYAEPGKEEEFEYIAVQPDGSAAPAGNLRAELYRDRWQTVLRVTPSGTYRYESTRDPLLISTLDIPAGQERGRIRFTPPEFGSYRMVATDVTTGASSAVEFYASGWGYSPWAIKNPARLEIDLDQDEYVPGETALAQVRAPFAGKLLISVESNRIHTTQIHTLTGNTAQIRIPIRADYRPNAYVTATLVRSSRDLDEGSVARSFGAVPLPVDRERNQVSVQIHAPSEIRPNSNLTVEITSAANGHVTLAAVDEGILQLVAQKTPDPFAFFYKKRALSVGSYDIFALLLPEVSAEGSSPAGGGAGDEALGQFVRTEGIRRVKPVAFWSGLVSTDNNGKARIELPVPEFQGALRLMAVGYRADRFGSAEQLTRVRSPLVILPTLPRFLSFEESALIPVTIRNDTGRAGTFQVRARVAGPAGFEDPENQAIEVPDGSERTAYFTLKTAGTPGELEVTLHASGNGEQTQSIVLLPVRPDLPARTLQNVGRVEGERTTLPLDPTVRFRPDTLTRQLRISPLPLVQFSAQLSNLLRYPHGCLEQTISRVFPLLYFDNLARELEPDLFRERSAAAFVEAGIRRLQTMQLHSGGFGAWPGSTALYPWGSIYSTHFLVEARKAGFHIDDYAYRQAVRYVSSSVQTASSYTQSHLEQSVYALYVLARAGEADLGTMDFIRENHRPKLRPVSRALLGAAYASAGNPQLFAELLRGLVDAEDADRETGDNLNSTLRNRSLILLALTESNPGDPRIPELVDRLAREVRTSWWTTQESGFAFLALGSFFQQQQSTAQYSGVVLSEGQEIGRFDEKTTVFSGITGTAPLTVRMNSGYMPGAAFFNLSTRGIPTDDSFRADRQGLEIQHEYLNRQGSRLGDLAVEQGDLVVVRTRVRSLSGPVKNVVVSMLLPSGLEVENPRLKTTETLTWMVHSNLNPAYLDLRDDRVLLFVDLPQNKWLTSYSLLRAVTPGQFRLPPLQAEAMYNPALRATGRRGAMTVEVPR